MGYRKFLLIFIVIIVFISVLYIQAIVSTPSLRFLKSNDDKLRIIQLESRIKNLESRILISESSESHIIISKNHSDETSEPETHPESFPIENSALLTPKLIPTKKLAPETSISELLVPPTLKVTPLSQKQITVKQSHDFYKWQRKECIPVYFLGGGKCGSTTIAMLLKHQPPTYQTPKPTITNQFAAAGKEVCWVEKIHSPEAYWQRFNGCSKTDGVRKTLVQNELGDKKLFALDACPRTYTESHAKKIASVHPNAKFIMPVRDPVLRKISHLNDNMIRGHGSKDIEKLVKKTNSSGNVSGLSKFGKILGTFLKYFDSDQFIIVRNDALSKNTQQVVDDIFKFLGGEKQEVTE